MIKITWKISAFQRNLFSVFIHLLVYTYKRIWLERHAYIHSIKKRTICHAWDLWNFLGLVNCCVYYARQTREICQVLPHSVDYKAPGELWNPLIDTVFNKCSFNWNKGSVNIWHDRKWSVNIFPNFWHWCSSYLHVPKTVEELYRAVGIQLEGDFNQEQG